MERPPEGPVIARCQKGDEDGFRQFMDLYRGYVYLLCHSMSRDKEEALDLCQEVFLAAFRAVKSVRQGAPVKPWLRRVAVNTCLNYGRSPRSGLRLQLTAEGTLDAPHLGGAAQAGIFRGSDGDPAEQVESMETRQAVRQAMNSLTPDQRLAVVLFHQEGLTYEEIVAETGWPLGTVKTNLYRGRKQLGRLMKVFMEGGSIS